jgi:hypothetical protein
LHLGAEKESRKVYQIVQQLPQRHKDIKKRKAFVNLRNFAYHKDIKKRKTFADLRAFVSLWLKKSSTTFYRTSE